MSHEFPTGEAFAVDAFGCDAERLRSVDALRCVFDAIVAEVGLRPVAPAAWHAFPAPGGVTGFLLLSESHLAVHTFPERQFAAFDLYCCVPRAPWRWDARLAALLGAERVTVRRLERGESAASPMSADAVDGHPVSTRAASRSGARP